ncbi:MAG: IS110 family transposase [Candidatus Omnitrophica bacterium]|nr:IS110 family transposase [Candidatus Omnitrophota bacterium]
MKTYLLKKRYNNEGCLKKGNRYTSIGIVPSIHQSENFSHTGKITKQGNKYLRWALIEASQKAIIKDPYLKAIYDKITYKDEWLNLM